MIVIVLALVAALLFAAEEGSVNAQQLVARRLRQRRNVIAIADADGSLDNDSKRTSRSRTLSSSTAAAAVSTPHHTSSRENTKNSNNAHFFNQDDLEYWRGMIRKTEEIMSMPHAAATKAEESKHKSSKAAKMTKTEKKEKMYHNPNTRNEEYHAMKKMKKEEEEGKW